MRHGALALLAGLDVHTGKVFASTPKTTGIVPFMDLVGRVLARPEYSNAPRVFVVAGNGSDHRGKKAASRLRRETRHPAATPGQTATSTSARTPGRKGCGG